MFLHYIENKERLFDLYNYIKERKDRVGMGIIVTNILTLRLDDYFKQTDKNFKKQFDEILEDLDSINDEKFDILFQKV